MSKIPLKIDIKINFYNECFFGGGKGSGLIDSFVIKDSKNKPYIPASSIKGRIKYNFSMLMNSFHILGEFCGFENIDRGTKNKKCNCVVCKLFGREGNKPGVLYFEDLKLTEETAKYSNDYSSRTGIKVNRYTKTVKDNALFRIQTSGMGGLQEFQGNIEGYIDKEDYEMNVFVLYTAIAMIKTMGGNQSRGLGWIDDISINVYADDNEVNKETLKNWGELLEV